MKSQSYSNASNARRAALKAGFTVDQFKIVPNGSTGCSFEVPGGIEPGVAALATMSPTEARAANNARLATMGLTKQKPTKPVSDVTTISMREMRGDDLRTPATTTPTPKTVTEDSDMPTKTTARKPTSKRSAAAARQGTDTVKAPKGMVVEILKLASREKGVSRDELNQLTEWKGAPWKWLFKNPKKTGYCDRWGYSFRVGEGKDGEVRYFTEKKAA